MHVLLDLLVPFRSCTCPIADFLRARRALDVVGADPKGISGEDQLAALALDLLAGPMLQTGAPGVTFLHAGGVGVANSSDDMLGVDCAQLAM